MLSMYDCNRIYSLKNTFYENQRSANSENISLIKGKMNFIQDYSNQNSYIPPSFEDFHTVVQSVVTYYINEMTEMDKVEMREMFKNWKNEPDKLNVNAMYNSSKWRAIYTKELFWSRMQTVDCCIREMLQINSVNSALKMVTTITSIGCGPGPDIASIISLLRSLNLRHHISVVGIDQFDGWCPYIDIMNSVDVFTAITFGKMMIDENSVKYLDNGDMCIMSYTDASIHTSKFWEQLKLKFNLILILDQNKQELFLELKRQNFEDVNYNLKGNKRFFYFMQSELQRKQKSEISCKESSNISYKKFSTNKTENGKNKFFDKEINNLDNYLIGDGDQKKKIENNSFNNENILNNKFQTTDYVNEVIEIDCSTTDDENSGAENTYKISLKTDNERKPKYEDLVNNFEIKKCLPLTNVSNKSMRKSRNRRRKKLSKLIDCKSNQMSKSSSEKANVLKRLGKMADSYHISPFSDNYVYKSTSLYDNSNYSINNQQTNHQITQPAPTKHFNFEDKNSYFNSSLNSSYLSRDTFKTSLFSGYSNNNRFIPEHEHSNNYKNNSSGLNFITDRQFSSSKLNSSRIFYNNDSVNFESDFKINSNSLEPRFYKDINGIWLNRKKRVLSFPENYSEEPTASALKRTMFSDDISWILKLAGVNYRG